MIIEELDITTPDGEMTTWIYRPEHDGPHPVVLFLMDAPSIRPALHEMASRLASAGYYVMMPYLFYRGGPYREFGASDEDMHARRDLMATVTNTNIIGDAEAMLAVAAKSDAARDGKYGAVGYCMSGGPVISLARAMPERVGGVASIHGAWLVKDTPDSPHLGLEAVIAEVYLGWADNDPTAPAEDLLVMREALDSANVNHVLDFLPDALHGYAPPHGERYNREASELHWERIHSLFRRTL